MVDKSGLVEIEVLMDFKARDRTQYIEGEKCFVTKDERARWCAAGWAKDPTGEVPTGEPNRGNIRLTGVQNIRHTVKEGK